jgi:hypothetical protein
MLSNKYICYFNYLDAYICGLNYRIERYILRKYNIKVLKLNLLFIELMR